MLIAESEVINMKLYKTLRNLLFGISVLMLFAVYLKAGSWELGCISFSQLGKFAGICIASSFFFAIGAFLCDTLYRIELHKSRKLKQAQRRIQSAKNRQEIMKKVKKPIFDEDRHTA